MRKTIERIPISIEPTQKVLIPFNAEILGFDMLDGKPGFNVLVEEGYRDGERTLLITTYSKEIPYNLNKTKYLGTFRTVSIKENKTNVFFVFEE